ncbi:MAG: hypothetical protein HRO68_08390 [Nitrosopumilus sp.]|nr:hypothetical protein [Nitrosopumilus sp.]
MKNSKMSLFFVFALTAIIAISYLPVNAEEMGKAMMMREINEMGESSMYLPNKQMSMGVDGKDVVCNAGLIW